MNEPREPGTPKDPGIALPSWVDDAISKSRTSPGGESAPADGGPAAEMAVNPPPPAEKEAIESGWEPVSQAGHATKPLPVVVAEPPRDARRRAVLPWVALALIFLGAALAVGYILVTRSVQR